MLIDFSQGNLSTKILGQPMKMQILIASMPFQFLAHP